MIIMANYTRILVFAAAAEAAHINKTQLTLLCFMFVCIQFFNIKCELMMQHS